MSADRENELVMSYAPPPPAQPFWVVLGLWGISHRWLAWVFVWLSVAAVVASLALGLVLSKLFLLGTLMVFAALWYWLSIRWVDRHGGWSQVRG